MVPYCKVFWKSFTRLKLVFWPYKEGLPAMSNYSLNFYRKVQLQKAEDEQCKILKSLLPTELPVKVMGTKAVCKRAIS